MKSIILAAGRGERLGSITDKLPKPMIPINDKPVLEYIIRLCKKHSIDDIAINTSYLPEQITTYFGNGEKLGVNLRYSFEPELLGTSGALNNFRDFLTEPFFVIYGDVVTDLNLQELNEFHKEKSAIATLNIYREKIIDKKTEPGWVVLGKKGKIDEIIEKPSGKESTRLSKISKSNKFFNSGIYLLEPEVLKLIPPGYSDFARDILPQIVKSRRAYGFTSDCYLKEVGQTERYLRAKSDIESGKVKFDF